MKRKGLSAFTIGALLVIFLAIAFTLYRGIKERNRTAKAIDMEIEQTLKTVNEKVDGFYDDVNRTLILVANAPEVKSGGGKECENYLRIFLQDHAQYSNIGVTDTNGNVICSAVQLKQPVNLVDRTYFLEAKEALLFSPGVYRINRITNNPSVSFGYPILADDGKAERVVFATIGTGWFKKLVADSTTRENVVITIIDKNGTILAREPEFEKWVGTFAADKPLVKVAMAKIEDTAELPGLDGVKRYYKFLLLLYGPRDSGYLAVGASKKEAVERIDEIFVRTISFLVLASIGIFILNVVIGGVRENNYSN